MGKAEYPLPQAHPNCVQLLPELTCLKLFCPHQSDPAQEKGSTLISGSRSWRQTTKRQIYFFFP